MLTLTHLESVFATETGEREKERGRERDRTETDRGRERITRGDSGQLRAVFVALSQVRSL